MAAHSASMVRSAALDRTEIGRVGRQVEQHGAGRLDRLPHAGHLVGGQIVHDDNVAGHQRGSQAVLEIGAEDPPVHRPVDDKGCGYRIDPHPRHQGGGLPVTVRHATDQPGTAPAIARARGPYWWPCQSHR